MTSDDTKRSDETTADDAKPKKKLTLDRTVVRSLSVKSAVRTGKFPSISINSLVKWFCP